jgi:tetratricopeptide (TPR) repeat protein
LSLLVLLILPLIMLADDVRQHYDPNAKLGAVSFPIPSCSAGVQKPFERGVALLHSFWYGQAEKQFKAVAAQDPQCAMAYWGEAVSLYHQLWNRPDTATVQMGWELIQKAQAFGAKTPRERGYIDAMAAFYRTDHGKWDFEKRTTAYSHAMAKVYESNPQDHEAATFYVLSLLASEPENDTTFANRKKAISILNALFQEDPSHPGVAHYLIHACDNPQFAQQGLAAAQRYAKIAPASPHALHMPSHIFARLGLWQQDIDSNLASIAATQHNETGMHMGAENQVHAMDFLEYAFLQIGEDAKAQAVVEQLASIRPQDVDPSLKGYLNRMRAHFPAMYALETNNWKEAVALQPPSGAEPYNQAITYWAQAVGAGHLRAAATARRAVDQYDAMIEATRKSDKPYAVDGMSTNRDEATAWLAFAEGQNEEAIGLLKSVADKQDAIGKGEVELPAREMLADMLLQLDRPQEALAQYEKSMKIDPNRFNALAGAAQAADQTHEPAKAATYYAALLKNCDGSNSDRPELVRARALVAQK